MDNNFLIGVLSITLISLGAVLCGQAAKMVMVYHSGMITYAVSAMVLIAFFIGFKVGDQ